MKPIQSEKPAHTSPKEIAALRATISTLPITDDAKRTWLAVIRQVEQMPDTHADLMRQCDEAMARYEKARKTYTRAIVTFAAALMLNVATLGMLIGGLL